VLFGDRALPRIAGRAYSASPEPLAALKLMAPSALDPRRRLTPSPFGDRAFRFFFHSTTGDERPVACMLAVISAYSWWLVVSGGGRHGHGSRNPCKMPLSPFTVIHTGQESGGELWEIFRLWSFLQSKSVNNVCKLLPADPLPGLCDRATLGTPSVITP